MTRRITPTLDNRDAERVLMELMSRQPAYLPAWNPAEGQSGLALLHIFSRYMQAVIERLNEAPDKNLLAFLDMLGVNLIPAQAARAPVVFTPLPDFGNGQIAARTRLGAQSPGQSEPLVFETDSAIALAAARLVEVKTLWPTRDEYSDHTIEWAGGRPFTLFENRQPVLHEFYIAHNTLLAFAGKSTVEIEFELSTPGSESLAIIWEYWDGQVWQSFREFDSTDESASRDGTDGLTRSGVITLRAECGQSEKTTVDGIETYWVRGRLSQPLPPDPARVLAEIDRVQMRSMIDPIQFAWEVTLQNTEEDEPPIIRGVVSRFHGIKIPAAEVILLRNNDGVLEIVQTTETNGHGEYSFDAVEETDRTYTLRVIHSQLPEAEVNIPIGATEVGVNFRLVPAGVFPDMAISDSLSIDLNKTFYPLGQNPIRGTTFFFSNQDIFSKPGAVMVVWMLTGPKLASGSFATLKSDESQIDEAVPEVAWEYWNGFRWVRIFPQETGGPFKAFIDSVTRFQHGGGFSITVPSDMATVTVNGEKAYWMRARLISGTYQKTRQLEIPGFDDPIEIDEPDPPVVEEMRLSYTYRSPWQRTEHCLTYNDFRFEFHSNDVLWPGNFFPAFRPVSDTTPSLYLGFDQPLPNDLVSFYMDIQEQETSTSPLVWEAWDGESWKDLRPTDETVDLQRPGMVSFIAPDVAERPKATMTNANAIEIIVEDALQTAVFETGDQLLLEQDKVRELATVFKIEGELISLETPLNEIYTGGTVSLAPLPRFGKPRDWIRMHLKQDGAPPEPQVNGIHLNATWASQVQTIDNEVLGSGTGQPNQTLFFTQVPVLPGEIIEVRELQGARAEVELPILKEELLKQGLNENDIRLKFDARDGRIDEVWIRWQYRPHLFFSGPDDRHYMIERASGRLIFGGRGNGRIPTVAPNNIQAKLYRAGGGVSGNVPVGQINQLLGAAPFVQEVINPRAAEGGADGELVSAVKSRGPETIRHQGRGLSTRDFEALAREASPGVAVVRALPMTASNLRPAPGWVTVIIVPQSEEPRPQPTFELLRQVHGYLAIRTPATLTAERIGVIGPTYLPIGVAAVVVPLIFGEAGVVEALVRTSLERFLHPLTGGPESCGWPFGRDVFLSDLAAVLEAIDGVDYVKELNLLLNDTPRGERIEVPPDRIVVADSIQVEVQAGERIGI